jgi:hypothetical protein
MGSMSVDECVDVDLVESATYEEECDHKAENGENAIEHGGSIDAFGEIWGWGWGELRNGGYRPTRRFALFGPCEGASIDSYDGVSYQYDT